MMVLVTYDVDTISERGKYRLRKVAKLCENHGQRVQFSVFECVLEYQQWLRLRARLLDMIDPERDSLRFYFLGSDWRKQVEHVGAKPGYDPEGPLIL